MRIFTLSKPQPSRLIARSVGSKRSRLTFALSVCLTLGHTHADASTLQ